MNLLAKISSLFERKQSISITNESAFYRFFGGASYWRSGRTYSGDYLANLYRRNELAYACIQKIADVMNDAELIVEKQNSKGEYERVLGHPLAALMKKPNVEEIGLDLRKKMVISENSLGITYIRLIRPRPMAPPVEIYILNPNRVTPQINYSGKRIDCYRYSNLLGYQEEIPPENMIIRRRVDLTDEFYGLAPLAVAANIISADENLTDYVNSFFDGADGSAGIPAGILKFTGNLSQEKADHARKLWNKNTRSSEVQVLDANADFQAIGSKLSEINSSDLRQQNEARICSVFGVPAKLVGAYVGYKNTTNNATAKTELKDFWLNKISPELKQLREWATWFMLPLFEDMSAIRAEKIRVGWDLSQMLALMEETDALHDRARKNLNAGGWTLNEFREATGKLPDPKGNYYLQPFNIDAVSPDNRAQTAAKPVQQGTNPADPPKGVDFLTSEDFLQKVVDFYTNKPKEYSNASTSAKKQEIADAERLLLSEKKTFDFNGLTLFREPNEHEKLIDLKSLVEDLGTQSENLQTSLLKYREVLISEAVAAAENLDAQTIFTLTLARNEKQAKAVKKRMAEAFETGRAQIVKEINAQRKKSAVGGWRSAVEKKELLDPEERLAEISDSVLSRLINEITARTVNAYTALKILGFDAANFFDELKNRITGESAAFVSGLAKTGANSAMMDGRSAEISEQKENWDRVQYSALLDANCCENCADEDGTESTNEDDLTPVPNSDCLGGANCRCFHVVILDG